MALSILDGNQSATTLSTILSSGQHITAHTVVSLGTQAITDMRGAVSGSVVSISNFPASQSTTFGAVTGSVSVLNFPASQAVTFSAVSISNFPATQTIAGTVTARLDGNANYVKITDTNGDDIFLSNGNLPISGTVTVGNSVTIGSLPAISGTVTANTVYATNVTGNAGGAASTVTAIPVALVDRGVYGGSIMNYDGANTSLNINVKGSLPALVAGTAQIGSVTASISGTVPISISSVTVGNSVTIGSLPAISGTVTANTFALQGTAVTTSNFTSTTASTVLAGFNATREVLTIFNEGAGNLHICAGATCTTIAYQVRLSAGDYYEVPNHQTTITHSAVFATAGTARVTEVS